MECDGTAVAQVSFAHLEPHLAMHATCLLFMLLVPHQEVIAHPVQCPALMCAMVKGMFWGGSCSNWRPDTTVSIYQTACSRVAGQATDFKPGRASL